MLPHSKAYSFVTFLLLAAAARGADGDLSLGGVVVNSRTGEPVNRALVQIVRYQTAVSPAQDGRPRAPRSPLTSMTFTDASGRFRFDALAAGNCLVSVQKPQFVAEDRGQNLVELTASRDDLTLKITPLGVITGKVTDQNGEPKRGVNVVALSTQIVDGLRQTQTDRNVTTDDRGIYRMWNVSPGKYVIKAAGWSGGTFLYAGDSQPQFFADESFKPVYFGGGKSLDSAAAIRIEPGTEATADVAIQLEPAFKIRGSLANFVPRRTVKFELLSGDEDVSAGRAGVNGDTGRFEVQFVADGSYIVRATQGQTSGELPVTVSGADVSGVTVSLAGSVEVKGRVTVTNLPPDTPSAGRPARRPNRQFCMLSLYPGRGRAGRAYSSRPGAGEEIAISDVMPGVYRVAAQCFGAYVQSMFSGNQDLLTNPLLTVPPEGTPPPIEVIAKLGGGAIHGTVSFSSPSKRPVVRVLLAPQFQGSTGPVLTQAFAPEDGSGAAQFNAASLAPGIYAVYAFLDQADIEYRNPQFLRSLSGGVGVQVDDGGDKEIQITDVIR